MPGSRQRLPNSPLVEVAFEVRFAGNFAVTAHLDEFQRHLGDAFPKLLVPNAKEGEPLSLKPVSFVTADDSERINVGLNLFAYVTTQYSTFAEFRGRALEVWVQFCRMLHHPTMITRLGLRYVNALPWVEGSSPGRFHPWLNSGLSAAMEDRPLTQLHVELTTQMKDGGTLHVGISRVREASGAVLAGTPDVAEETLLLDFDYAVRSIPSEEVERALESGHAIIDDAFFQMLTADGLRSLGGTE